MVCLLNERRHRKKPLRRRVLANTCPVTECDWSLEYVMLCYLPFARVRSVAGTLKTFRVVDEHVSSVAESIVVVRDGYTQRVLRL